jgi:hypothetical protein
MISFQVHKLCDKVIMNSDCGRTWEETVFPIRRYSPGHNSAQFNKTVNIN